MKTLMTKASLAAFACAVITACASSSRNVAQLQRTQYAIDEGTASTLVRESLEEYPLVERGEPDRFETRWVPGREGTAYKLVVHIDGPGGGPFMVRVMPKLRTKSGDVVEYDIPGWLAAERDRVAVEIHGRLEPTAIEVEAPAAVATQ